MSALRLRRSATLLSTLVLVLTLGAQTAGATGGATYRVQLDAFPPPGEPWAFLKIFPNALTVHQGDLVDAAFKGTDTPHTGTFVPTADPNAWRNDNQGPGGAYAPIVPDTAPGGDESRLVVNPTVANPSDPSCGTSATPCTFNGSSVVNLGFQLPNPPAEPSIFTKVTAPVGTYSFLCLLHPGMQILLNVVSPGTSIPSPRAVRERAMAQVARAIKVSAPVADATAQAVSVKNLGGGHIKWSISAGGFYRNVSANEYVNSGLSVHVGDQVQVNGNFEIHTATLPASSAATIPFVRPECESPGGGADTSPPCASPDLLELAINSKAITPTAGNGLWSPTAFRNSGLLDSPAASYTFVAKKPGTYSVVCLVHGPEMTTTITVEG